MTDGISPTVDRSKLGTKRHILTDKNGIPISVIVTSANTHDIKLVTKMLSIMQLSKDLLSPYYLQQKKERERRISTYALIEPTTPNQ